MRVDGIVAVRTIAGDITKIAILAAAGDMHIAKLLRLGDRFFGPGPRDQIISCTVLGQEIHRQHKELRRGAPL